MNNVLFLDIETVPQKENWSEVPETIQELFSKKTAYQRKEEVTAKIFMNVLEYGQSLGKLSVFL
jgi:hypothetical protein